MFLTYLLVVAAASGRLVLALATWRARTWLPKERVKNLEAAGDYVTHHKGRSALGLALFALSPLPLAQLFEAAGLAQVGLLPITGAFFVGRLVSYSIYLALAGAAEATFGDAFRRSLTSWPSIALQVAMLIGIVLLSRVDWSSRSRTT